MTLRAWRIVKAKHARTAFTGDGARSFGGRWNSPGAPVIYAAGSVSLAMLELLVHLQRHEMLQRYAMWELAFDEALVKRLDEKALPTGWRRSPPPATTQHIGDEWLAEASSAILRVPSAVAAEEFNYLLNPIHADFAKIRIGRRQRVKLDPRLVKA